MPQAIVLFRRSRQHHPSGSAEFMIETIERADAENAALVALHAAHARWPGRFHPRHRHQDDRGQNAGRGLRRPLGQRARHLPVSSSRSRPTWPRWRRARTSARPTRCRAAAQRWTRPRRRRPRKTWRPTCGRLRPSAARNVQLAEQAVLAEQGVHGRGSAEGHAAAHRSDRHESRRPARETRRPNRHAVRRPHRDAAHGVRAASCRSR